MKKRSLWLTCLVIIQLLIFSSLATATNIPLANKAQTNRQEPKKSPVITDLGDKVRVDYIYYAKSSSIVNSVETDPGYKLMGIKWLQKEGYVVNLTSIPDELTSKTDAMAAIKISSNTWDASTSKTLFGKVTEDNAAHYGIYDYKNTVEFRTYDDPDVIAVTSVWYNTRTKAILEFDMLFNSEYFEWSTNGAPGTMDLRNIATHEFGHAVGLADIYNSSYSYVTMYGYADYGETDKRSLAKPDITGLQKIYGR